MRSRDAAVETHGPTDVHPTAVIDPDAELGTGVTVSYTHLTLPTILLV